MDTKAYLKSNPEEKGHILRVYSTAEGNKRLLVRFQYGQVDAAADDFEILVVDRNEVLND
jgi:hypothetical protein